MSDVKHADGAVVAVIFIDVSAVSPDDFTGKGTEFIWYLEPDKARELQEQLCGLLGEPDLEVLLDDPAVKACKVLSDSHGVKLERA